MSSVSKWEANRFFFIDHRQQRLDSYAASGHKWDTFLSITEKVLQVALVLLPIALAVSLHYYPGWNSWRVFIPVGITLMLVHACIKSTLESSRSVKLEDDLAKVMYQGHSAKALKPTGIWDANRDKKLRSDRVIKKLGKTHQTVSNDVIDTINHHDLELTPFAQTHAAVHIVDPKRLDTKWRAIQTDIRRKQPAAAEAKAYGNLHHILDFPLKAAKDDLQLKEKVRQQLERDQQRRMRHHVNPPKPSDPQQMPSIVHLKATRTERALEQQLIKVDKSLVSGNYANIALMASPLLVTAGQTIAALYTATPFLFIGSVATTTGLGALSQKMSSHLIEKDNKKQAILMHQTLLVKSDIENVAGTHPRLNALGELQKRLGLDGVQATWARALAEGDSILPQALDYAATKEQIKQLAAEALPITKRYLRDRIIILKSQLRPIKEKFGVSDATSAKEALKKIHVKYREFETELLRLRKQNADREEIHKSELDLLDFCVQHDEQEQALRRYVHLDKKLQKLDETLKNEHLEDQQYPPRPKWLRYQSQLVETKAHIQEVENKKTVSLYKLQDFKKALKRMKYWNCNLKAFDFWCQWHATVLSGSHARNSQEKVSTLLKEFSLQPHHSDENLQRQFAFRLCQIPKQKLWKFERFIEKMMPHHEHWLNKYQAGYGTIEALEAKIKTENEKFKKSEEKLAKLAVELSILQSSVPEMRRFSVARKAVLLPLYTTHPVVFSANRLASKKILRRQTREFSLARRAVRPKTWKAEVLKKRPDCTK